MGGRTYTFRNGVPQSVTIYNQPFNVVERTNTIGLFAQDQWKLSNVTLNVGLRYDGFNGNVPERHSSGWTLGARAQLPGCG